MCIEIDASCPESSCLKYNKHGFGCLIDIGRELIRIPSVLVISLVGIYASYHIIAGCNLEIVGKGVACQCRMVYFNIQLEVLVETIVLQEADNRCCIVIVLVLGGFHRLRFNEEGSRKALLPSVIACLCKHHGQMIEFPLHIGVVKTRIPFASSPENIVIPSESYSRINCILKLDSRICENRKIGIGGSTVHIPWIAEQICRAPQKLHPCLVLQFLHHRHVFFKAFFNIEYRPVVSNNVNIMEAIIGGPNFGGKLERRIQPVANLVIELHVIPREKMRCAAKLIGTITTE